MADHQVLFCPFCRESYEGQVTCPDHDLLLVPFDRLGPDPMEERVAAAHDEGPVGLFDPRLGRGLVALGAVLECLAFPLTFVVSPSGAAITTFATADSLPTLWTLGLVGFTQLFVLHRRRTPAAMRSLRVLLPLVSIMAPACMVWALWKLRQGAFVFGADNLSDASLGPALYVVVVGALVASVGGARLGVHRQDTRAQRRSVSGTEGR